MDILLLDKLVPEALQWLSARHPVVLRPELAADPSALRAESYRAQAMLLPRKIVITREFLDFAPRLRCIARTHSGTDNIDLEACRQRNVRVIVATSAQLRANAEYLLAGLLLLYRRGIGASLAGNRHAEQRLGRELGGSTVGMLGLAPAGHALAMMLHSLGVRMIGYDPAVHHTQGIWKRLNIQPASLHDLMAQADAVSVQTIYASRYKGFINANVLSHCRPGQLWVSVSRSGLFDIQALAAALTDGRIAAALIDGAEAGFASRESPLHQLDNLYLTPRVGSFTREAQLRASWYVVQRIHETLASGMTVREPPAADDIDMENSVFGDLGKPV